MLDLKEYLKPMTTRELMLERVRSSNVEYKDMFIITISMTDEQPIIQAYYEGRMTEGEDEPPSLNIGKSVITNLRRVMAMSSEEEENGDGEVRH